MSALVSLTTTSWTLTFEAVHCVAAPVAALLQGRGDDAEGLRRIVNELDNTLEPYQSSMAGPFDPLIQLCSPDAGRNDAAGPISKADLAKALNDAADRLLRCEGGEVNHRRLLEIAKEKLNSIIAETGRGRGRVSGVYLSQAFAEPSDEMVAAQSKETVVRGAIVDAKNSVVSAYNKMTQTITSDDLQSCNSDLREGFSRFLRCIVDLRRSLLSGGWSPSVMGDEKADLFRRMGPIESFYQSLAILRAECAQMAESVQVVNAISDKIKTVLMEAHGSLEVAQQIFEDLLNQYGSKGTLSSVDR